MCPVVVQFKSEMFLVPENKIRVGALQLTLSPAWY